MKFKNLMLLIQTPKLNNWPSTHPNPNPNPDITPTPPWQAIIRINKNYIILALIDCGSNKSCISLSYCQTLNLTIHQASEGVVKALNIELPRLGHVIIDLFYDHFCLRQAPLEVINHTIEQVIFGRDIFPYFNIGITGVYTKPPGC
jgi:hypothetical protein